MFQVKVDGFQGPLDLLLDLIERQELDIAVLSLVQVTDQYWQYVESAGGLEPEALADFILIGSKLLYLKSCALLPSAAPPRADLRPEAREMAEELTQMLEEYKRFRDAAHLFRELEDRRRRTYPRSAPPKGLPLPPGLQGVTLDTLLKVVQEALARRPPEPEEAVLEIETITVEEKVRELTDALSRSGGRLPFNPLLAACQSRTEIVVLFLAVLELIKAGRLWAEQDRPFGQIVLVETVGEPA